MALRSASAPTGSRSSGSARAGSASGHPCRVRRCIPRDGRCLLRAAIAAGGKDNGPPGLRPQYHANYYAAFVLDPDGNNIEAVCHAPALKQRSGSALKNAQRGRSAKRRLRQREGASRHAAHRASPPASPDLSLSARHRDCRRPYARSSPASAGRPRTPGLRCRSSRPFLPDLRRRTSPWLVVLVARSCRDFFAARVGRSSGRLPSCRRSPPGKKPVGRSLSSSFGRARRAPAPRRYSDR